METTLNKIEDLLGEFGLSLVNDTRSSLKRKLDERAARNKGRIRNKSNLWASVKDSVKYQSGTVTFKLKMNDYWAVVNDGRKPSPVSSIGQDKLVQWSEVSGFAQKIRKSDLANRLDKQKEAKSKPRNKNRKFKTLKEISFEAAKKRAGYLVANKLKTKRIEPTHFFDEVINDGRVKELESRLSELIKNEIIIEITNGFNS